jgi:acetyl-CoA/propionyl-CoA carboxylase carboxyl transferase subunit
VVHGFPRRRVAGRHGADVRGDDPRLGRVPQICVVVGPAAGGAAYGPALTDVVIMAPTGKVFVTGPDVVRSVTGEQIDQDGLGGADAHGKKSGVVHVIARDAVDAYVRARRFTGLFADPGLFDLHSVREESDLRALLPERRSALTTSNP